MPTYQYSCTSCGHFLEVFQSFHEDSLTVCPDCEGRLRKVFNAVGVVFKGSGFYRNDSRGKQTSGDAASPSNGSSTSAAEKSGTPAPAAAAAKAGPVSSPGGSSSAS